MSRNAAFTRSFAPDHPHAADAGMAFEPVKAPWVRLGGVVHDAENPAVPLLAGFAHDLRNRGFLIAGMIPERGKWRDLASDCVLPAADAPALTAAASLSLRRAMRENADLVVMPAFPPFRAAAERLSAVATPGELEGVPVLTAFSGEAVAEWQDFTGHAGTMLAPEPTALWRWWGAESLYRDLTLGVADDEVRQIACGHRWIMVEGEHGSGLAYLPRYPKELSPRLPALAKRSLRELARLSASWDPLEMALGIAAINAHYNRSDSGGHMGNGAHHFSRENGRIVSIGAFPGLSSALPGCTVIETDPRPGEYPLVSMDTLLPGAAAVVVNSSCIVNRSLPRILRLAQGARQALVGPSTPMSSRLHAYGIEILGGLIVRDPKGLAAAVKRGGLPREFAEYGQYLYIRGTDSFSPSDRSLS
ncbi:MAG TPA: DUF364 domain-containing protein [Candidatus Sulfotelmatobacter sp.]|nr:DUF364 domain-containing protein [Candidatus Sulfotelmatobacter sp.]